MHRSWLELVFSNWGLGIIAVRGNAGLGQRNKKITDEAVFKLSVKRAVRRLVPFLLAGTGIPASMDTGEKEVHRRYEKKKSPYENKSHR